MYLIFFWVKREKPENKQKKTSVLGEGWGREEADTYQSHDAQPVSLLGWAVLPPSRLEMPTAGQAGAGMWGGGKQVEGAHWFKMTKAA